MTRTADAPDSQRHAAPPPSGTIERWCFDLVSRHDLAAKLRPPAPPDPGDDGHWEVEPPVRRLAGPGRPPELRVTARAPRTPAPEALVRVEVRARLMHTFLHHELQAAELFAWAILAFPSTPRAFRAGMMQLCREELRHLDSYARHLTRLGGRVGDFPVRDWFWQRVRSCADATAFVALLGLGLEGANLEHSARFASQFRAVGDHAGAEILDAVQRDEIGHVTFALRWFQHFTGTPLDYDRWSAALPAPLTPALLQGKPLNRAARRRAGMSDAFLDRLEAEPPTSVRRPG